ncbi:MAG: CPBP family intramembrane metalloprotease [Verrucomicrobiota bacterium]|nr:CPBP family intramembrane metalloprotease [Verrucomicrobiota bacterium]
MTNAWSQLLSFTTPVSPTVRISAGLMIALFLAGTVADVVLLVLCLRRKLDWPARFARLQSRGWTWREAGIILFAMTFLIAAFKACHMTAELLLPGQLRQPAMGLLLALVLLPQLTALALIGLLRRRRAPAREAFGINHDGLAANIGKALVFYVAAWPPLVLGSLAYLLFLIWLDYPIQRQEVVQWLMDPNLPLWFKLALAGIAVTIVPISEECFFRGVNMSAASKLVGPAPTVLFTSILFAMAHFQVAQFAPLLLIAMALSVAYLYTGSIVAPIVMHAAFNAMGILNSLLLRELYRDLSPALSVVGGW